MLGAPIVAVGIILIAEVVSDTAAHMISDSSVNGFQTSSGDDVNDSHGLPNLDSVAEAFGSAGELDFQGSEISGTPGSDGISGIVDSATVEAFGGDATGALPAATVATEARAATVLLNHEGL